MSSHVSAQLPKKRNVSMCLYATVLLLRVLRRKDDFPAAKLFLDNHFQNIKCSVGLSFSANYLIVAQRIQIYNLTSK